MTYSFHTASIDWRIGGDEEERGVQSVMGSPQKSKPIAAQLWVNLI